MFTHQLLIFLSKIHHSTEPSICTSQKLIASLSAGLEDDHNYVLSLCRNHPLKFPRGKLKSSVQGAPAQGWQAEGHLKAARQ